MSQTDSSPEVALEHLRVIRTLMERANVYRAVSAPAALCGGLMALGLGVFVGLDNGSKPFLAGEFLVAWLSVLVLSTLLNLGLLMREARGQGRPFITDELRTALRAVLPPLLVGGVLGVGLVWTRGEFELTALTWILCYGLALLATSGFAPKSIVRLGHAFLWGGLMLALVWFAGGEWVVEWRSRGGFATLLLSATFGMFHLIYAVLVFMSRKTEEV